MVARAKQSASLLDGTILQIGGCGYDGGRTGKKLKGVRGCCLKMFDSRRKNPASKFAIVLVCHFGVSPKRRIDVPTGSGGEPSSPNCGVSAGVKARQLITKYF